MDTIFNKTKEVILSFEKKIISLEAALNSLNELTNKQVEEYELLNYWRSESIDNFINRLIVEPIGDWEEIHDEKALRLIREIFNEIDNDVIFERNSVALEKRYSKVSGTIADWIFQDDIFDATKILELLKQNTTLLL